MYISRLDSDRENPMNSNTQIFHGSLYQSPLAKGFLLSQTDEFQIPPPRTVWSGNNFIMMDNTYVDGTGRSLSRLGGDNGGIAERSERSSRNSRTLLAAAWESPPLLIPIFREDITRDLIGLEELLLSTDDKNWSLASVFWTADEITELKMPEFLKPWIMTCKYNKTFEFIFHHAFLLMQNDSSSKFNTWNKKDLIQFDSP